MHGNLTADHIKKVCLYAGLAALIVGCGMAFEYGRAMSMLHAFSLSLLALAVSMAFVGAELFRSNGRKFAAAIITSAGVLLSIGEYGTHFASTVGNRVGEARSTKVQNAAYTDIQANKDSEIRNLTIFQDQLKSLNSEKQSMMAANAWVSTVKPDGLKSELATLKDRIETEKKTGREGRKGGCGKECERLQNAANDLDKRISSAEKFSEIGNDIDKKTKQIEATQRVLDSKVEVAVHTDLHSSKIVDQTQAFAQIAMWSTEPSAAALNWTQLVLGAVIAAITTYLAPFFFTIAFAGDAAMAKASNKRPGQRHVGEVLRLVDPRSACLQARDNKLCA